MPEWQCSIVQHRATPEARGAVAAQAEKLRSKAQRPEVSRSTQQLCRYLYYLGRIRAIQLEYTDSKDCLQQALRKVQPALFAAILLSLRQCGPFLCHCAPTLGSSTQSG